MGFMKDGGQVPTLDFFAKNFTVCDHWFAPLPADTQPNRLMALSGFTNVDVTVGQPLAGLPRFADRLRLRAQRRSPAPAGGPKPRRESGSHPTGQRRLTVIPSWRR
jgi:hypothetical protein